MLFRSGPVAMAVEASGEIHAVMNNGDFGVEYAYYDGCSWSVQLVDDQRAGSHAIAVDSGGRPHIEFVRMLEATGAWEYWHAYPAP